MSVTAHSSAPTPLDALRIPLQGIRLIEASAGTGKTYTIANLYLRLVLGHGGQTPLGVDQILVVTFTDAATGELRDRIRARIHEAGQAFMDGHSPDDFIQTLITELPAHEEQVQQLQAAERQMDEAAIFTIHGFCQRMLKQHAFESGTLFSSELLADEGPLLQTCAADFWRRTLYPMDRPLSALMLSLWQTPDALLGGITSWLNKPGLHLHDQQLPDSLAQFQRQYVEPIQAVRELWIKDMATIRALLLACGLKANSKTLKNLDNMEAFIQSDALLPDFAANDEGWALYSSAGIQTALKKSGRMPKHPVFGRIDQLLSHPLPLKKAFRGLILKQAMGHIHQQLDQLKASRHLLSFNDLLSHLAGALTGPHGPALATAIRQQFPVAMIDEFQDTDPQQYAIFSRIYRHSADSSTGLFMIGDPKQAIYAFRGADIFTYIKARRQVSAHYTLATNWRSSAAMVEVSNRIFAQAHAPFIYSDDIPFYPVSVSPSGRSKRLTIDGQPLAAGQLWLQTSPGDRPTVNGGDYLQTMAKATATQINRLLTLADQQRCLIHDGEHSRPLQARDIAILVRTANHGQQISTHLADQHIASVYLSHNDSVFACDLARDLQRLLAACLNPGDERALRAALASGLFGLDAAGLDQLNHDEQAWEQILEKFSHYQRIWFTQGILPMLRQIIYQHHIGETLLACRTGERQLTDLLHLGELLASQEQELDSHHGLYRWLSEAIDQPQRGVSEQQLHLESERNRVRIVTIHKSKGLEYNVVFLPFICDWREERQPLYHDDQHRTVLDLEERSQSLQQAEKERLAEDLRLLYVALTRSVHCCYMGLAPLKKGAGKNDLTDLAKTAIGYLLNGGNGIRAGELADLIDQLTHNIPAFAVSPPPLSDAPYQPPAGVEPTLQARQFSGRIEKDWWITSYSALSASAHSRPPVDASLETPGQEPEPPSAAPAPAQPHDPASLFCFPRGARAGTFLHTLFEQVFDRSNLSADDQPALARLVADALQKDGYEPHWQAALEQMLNSCLQTPLDGDDLRLGQLPRSARKVEMEFYLPIEGLDAAGLNALISHHDPLSASGRPLDFPRVKGMLKGFIDLTFEYRGKWYVLDYKSNWLGGCREDYCQTAMARAMSEHRYDLQYQFYTLALHRLLRQRIPDYDYDRHLGGVYYLFLRGISPNDPQRHGIFAHRPDKTLIEQLDRLFCTPAQLWSAPC